MTATSNILLQEELRVIVQEELMMKVLSEQEDGVSDFLKELQQKEMYFYLKEATMRSSYAIVRMTTSLLQDELSWLKPLMMTMN